MPTCSRRSRRSSNSTRTCRATWCSRSCGGCLPCKSPRPERAATRGAARVESRTQPRPKLCCPRRPPAAWGGCDGSERSHSLASLSLFGGKKIVELRLPSGKPGAQGGEAIAQYCERPSPDILFLVSLPRLDRMSQSSAWFGALSSAGVVVDVWPVERTRLPSWIAERLGRQRQRAPREALEFLADRVEGNLLAAHQEVQKLALLAPEGELDVDTVREVVANVARYDAYAAGEALLGGDAGRYLRIIDGLKSEGEAPTLVLWTLSEELFALAAIQAGTAAARVAPQAVQGALVHAARIDRAIKGVGSGQPWDEFLKLAQTLER